MAIYQRGGNRYVDFRFKGQRIRESIGPSRKDAEKVIAKKKTEIIENKYLDIRKEPDPNKRPVVMEGGEYDHYIRKL